MLRRVRSRLIIVAACLALSACDGGISAGGHVRDENGKPIKGALVTLISRGTKDERVTRDDGSYDVGVIHAPQTPVGKLTASKAGHQTFEKSFSSGAELGHNVEIVLKSAPVSTSP